MVGAKEIPAGQSAGQLDLAADEKLGDDELKAKLTVTVKLGELKAEQALELTVNKVKLPAFGPVNEVILMPGESASVDLPIQRNGFPGPLKFTVDGLPAKVTGTVADVAADQTTAKLQLAAPAGVAEGGQTIRVITTAFGRPVEAQVPLKIDSAPFRVQAFSVVNIAPGETKRIQVPIERRSYKGPLSLEVGNLPEGVTVKKVDVAPDQASAALEVVAEADAKERVRSASVVSTGGAKSRTDPVVIRVTYGKGFLPRDMRSPYHSKAH